MWRSEIFRGEKLLRTDNKENLDFFVENCVNDFFARVNWEFYERRSEASELNSRLSSANKLRATLPYKLLEKLGTWCLRFIDESTGYVHRATTNQFRIKIKQVEFKRLTEHRDEV